MSNHFVSLTDQVQALEDTVSNHRFYIKTVKRMVEEGKRPVEVLQDTEARLPKMEAALKTMKWLHKNEERIKKALA